VTAVIKEYRRPVEQKEQKVEELWPVEEAKARLSASPAGQADRRRTAESQVLAVGDPDPCLPLFAPNSCCGAMDGLYGCTRPPGHPVDQHVASDGERVVHTWTGVGRPTP
jgi:hypothetical protein